MSNPAPDVVFVGDGQPNVDPGGEDQQQGRELRKTQFHDQPVGRCPVQACDPPCQPCQHEAECRGPEDDAAEGFRHV